MLASFASIPRVRAEKPAPAIDHLSYTGCTPIATGGSGIATDYSIPLYEGVVQPFGEVGNIAACSLATATIQQRSVQFVTRWWDPLTLAPAAGHIALDTRTYSTTVVPLNVTRVPFVPPIIMQALPQVAEPPPSFASIQVKLTESPYGGSYPVKFVAADASSAPAARRVLADGSTAAIAGSHPVLVHAICGGDEALQALRVVQSVMSTDADLNAVTYEYIQKFRVPEASRLRWVELAFELYTPPPTSPQYGRIRVLDAEGQSSPPFHYGPALADAPFYVAQSYTLPARWAPGQDFAVPPLLLPNHDYWLVVQTDRRYDLMAKARTGSESPQFEASIGPLFRRYQSSYGAVEEPNRALAFRLIGEPVSTTAVPEVAPARAGFALRVAPNPARGAATIAWTGASGAVRLEVMDERGRRVASAAGAAGSGRWIWSATREGVPLPAGLYFVRARDESGRTATARVTRVK